MGLKLKTIRRAIDAAYKALGELVISATYRRTTSVYNPANGQMVKTNQDYPIKMVTGSFSNFEVDRVIVSVGDFKGIVKSVDMPVVPILATDSVILNGKTHNIIRVLKDPSDSITTLQLRAP